MAGCTHLTAQWPLQVKPEGLTDSDAGHLKLLHAPFKTFKHNWQLARGKCPVAGAATNIEQVIYPRGQLCCIKYLTAISRCHTFLIDLLIIYADRLTQTHMQEERGRERERYRERVGLYQRRARTHSYKYK